jgi:predicted RNase H-like HicB family nuclease
MRPALRAQSGNTEAEALRSHLSAMESTVEDLKQAGVSEPVRFAVHEDI